MNNKKTSFCPVILAGGGGTRLWPLSREHYPKQFLSFEDNKSMLQKTLQRLCSIQGDYEMVAPVLICNEEHRFLVEEHALEAGIDAMEIILEPKGRNTAPALTIVALKYAKDDPVLLIAPADHVITDISSFHQAVKNGFAQALNNQIVTFGIVPSTPETGYGYIKVDLLDTGDNALPVQEFVEKPDIETAKQYLESGNYFWNSGIFMMKASIWLEAIEEFRPDIYSACKAISNISLQDGKFFRLDDSFKDCPAESIDYAVLEPVSKKNNGGLVMLKTDPGWSDLGSWSAIFDIEDKDADNNVIQGNVVTHETSGSIISSHGRLVATYNCEDMLVIETADAVLVGKRDSAQDVKHLVNKLKASDMSEAVIHQRVYRPWGNYETLEMGKNYQVKRLVVKPGKKLSLQMHHRRAEHWVVVSGIATVTRGDDVFDLKVNESTFIPLREKHRLENRQETLLEVIEVQSGDYLGEDDIVRFEDDFGRHSPT